MAKRPDEHMIRAAGGVVWRRAEGADEESPNNVEVAVIHRPRYDDWSIPKGKLARGESEIEGAIREVLEETGLRVHVGRPLGEVRYMKRVGDAMRPKVVRYWSMQADGGQFVPTREVDKLRWVSLADAQSLLTHDHDKELLERFARGPALTGTVLVLRHALAGNSSEWEGDDRVRPLDERGIQQADELVRFLSRFEVQDIVSADLDRCTQSVEPLSDAIGVPIRLEPLFSEVGYPGNEAQAVKLLRSYVRPGDAVVICTQGEVVPDLLERVAGDDAFDLPQDLSYKKGSVWALSFDGDRLVGAEYFPPPETD